MVSSFFSGFVLAEQIVVAEEVDTLSLPIDKGFTLGVGEILVRTSTGALWTVYSEALAGGGYRLWAARSLDQGNTWEKTLVPMPEGEDVQNVDLVIDKDDRLHVFVAHHQPGEEIYYITEYVFIEGVWEVWAEITDDPGTILSEQDAEIDSGETIHIVYVRASDPFVPEPFSEVVYRVKSSDSDVWGPAEVIHSCDNGTGTPLLAIDYDDHPHIIFEQKCMGAVGAWNISYATKNGDWEVEEIYDVNESYGAFDIAVDSENLPHIVYWHTEGAQYRSCYTVRSGPGVWEPEQVLLTSIAPLSIGVDLNNVVHVASLGNYWRWPADWFEQGEEGGIDPNPISFPIGSGLNPMRAVGLIWSINPRFGEVHTNMTKKGFALVADEPLFIGPGADFGDPTYIFYYRSSSGDNPMLEDLEWGGVAPTGKEEAPLPPPRLPKRYEGRENPPREPPPDICIEVGEEGRWIEEPYLPLPEIEIPGYLQRREKIHLEPGPPKKVEPALPGPGIRHMIKPGEEVCTPWLPWWWLLVFVVLLVGTLIWYERRD